MALTVNVIQGGGTAAGTADFTDIVPLWDLSESGPHMPLLDVGMMANSSGGACQWQFTVHDDDGAVKYGGTPGGLEMHNVVLVTEDAPGYDAWLGRGRISTVEIETGDKPWGNHRTHVVTVDDANIDLKGLALTEPWARPEETDVARILAVGTAFLNGDPRATTVITAGTAHLVTTDVTRTMPAHTYPAGTDVIDIIEDCASTGGKNFQVVIHHKDSASHLCLMYLDEEDLTTFASTLSITDTSPNLTTSFPPIFDQGQAVVIDGGENPVSEMVVVYGQGTASYVHATAGTAITDRYDYWSAGFGDSNAETAAQGSARADGFLESRSVPIRTHQITIMVPAASVDELSAGMAINVRSARAFGGENLGQTVTRRIAQLKWELAGPEVGSVEPYYYAHMQLEQPRKLHLERFTRPGPQPPDTGTPGTCTRYYFTRTLSTDVSAPSVSLDANWDDTIGDAAENKSYMLTTTQGGGTADTSVGGLSTLGNVAISQYLYQLSGTGTISGKVKMQALARGDQQAIGSQAGQSQLIIKVVSSDGLTTRGTALAPYEPAIQDSANWPGSGNYTNRRFPAAALWGPDGATLASVSYQNGDYLVVEAGYRYYHSSLGDEAGITWDNNSSTDLPEDESTTASHNSWIQICTDGTSGDTTQPIGGPGDADPGDDVDTYAPIDHVHEHGDLSASATHMHDTTQIEGLSDGTTSEVVAHGTMGATETFDASAGSDHEGTLDENLTVTLTGATSGEAAWMTLKLTQDATGTNTIDLPASVVNGADVEAAFDTTANAVNVISIFTYDGGTTWYAFLAGGSGTTDASDVSVADSGGYYTGTDVEAALQEIGADLAGAGASKWIVDPGSPSYSGSGPVTVALTSKFGIDSSGNPYYNAANVTDGEEAALGWDSDTETYFLRPYYP